jgi:hypothetical protein
VSRPGYGDSLGLYVPGGGPITPGEYALGDASGPSLDIAIFGEGCSASSGTLDVLDYQWAMNDAGYRAPESLLMSYSVECAGIPLEGCIRYGRSSPFVAGDAGALPPLDGGDGGVDLLAPCAAGGNVIYVDAEGSFGELSGPTMITGALGTWSAGTYSLFQMSVTDIVPWQIDAELDSYVPGTYTSSGDAHIAPWIQLEANGTGCTSGIPTGTFTIATLEGNGVDITKLLMSFDLACPGLGTLRGCASFNP